MRNKRFLPVTALILCIVQAALILFSWLLTAAEPTLRMRSLLSNEGIRWFFGSFVENLASPIIIWAILLMVAIGTLLKSGITDAIQTLFSSRKLSLRQRLGLELVFTEAVVFTVIMLLLTVTPHAVLLSVTGHLFPSSFSQSIIPVVAFCITIFSVTFGSVSRQFHSLTDIYDTLTWGVSYCVPILPIYIIGMQLFESIRFVFIV